MTIQTKSQLIGKYPLNTGGITRAELKALLYTSEPVIIGLLTEVHNGNPTPNSLKWELDFLCWFYLNEPLDSIQKVHFTLWIDDDQLYALGLKYPTRFDIRRLFIVGNRKYNRATISSSYFSYVASNPSTISILVLFFKKDSINSTSVTNDMMLDFLFYFLDDEKRDRPEDLEDWVDPEIIKKYGMSLDAMQEDKIKKIKRSYRRSLLLICTIAIPIIIGLIGGAISAGSLGCFVFMFAGGIFILAIMAAYNSKQIHDSKLKKIK